MSTKITDIYAALVTLIQTALPDHKRLTEVDEIDENDASLLRQGWALKIGGATLSTDVICPQYNLERKFLITLTREYLAKDSDVVRRDNSKIQVLEDLHLILAAAVSDIQLGDLVTSFVYEDDGGPEELTLREKPYHMLEATFTVRYFQLVSGG